MNGSFPASFGENSVLRSIDFSGNSLSGPMSDFSLSSQIYYLNLENNTLDGSIPSNIGNLYWLNVLLLGNNTLEGKIPAELAQCRSLDGIRFEFNNLTGDIGSVIDTLAHSLTGLNLDDNVFTGTIPPSIGLLNNLDFLDRAHHNLNGTTPAEIGLLTKLEVLALYSNQLTGTLPSSLASLPLSKCLIFAHVPTQFSTSGSHVCISFS